MGIDISKGSGYKDQHFKVSYLYASHGFPGKKKKRTILFITTTNILVKDSTKKSKDPYKENSQMPLKEIVNNTGKSKKIHSHRSEE